MTKEDLDDLLSMIEALEERIIFLETIIETAAKLHAGHLDDSYYWNHG